MGGAASIFLLPRPPNPACPSAPGVRSQGRLPQHPRVSTRASPRRSRSSSHWLMWGNCSICRHFLLLPFRFPPPPMGANGRWVSSPTATPLPSPLVASKGLLGSARAQPTLEGTSGLHSTCFSMLSLGSGTHKVPWALLLGAPGLEDPRGVVGTGHRE